MIPWFIIGLLLGGLLGFFLGFGLGGDMTLWDMEKKTVEENLEALKKKAEESKMRQICREEIQKAVEGELVQKGKA